MGINQSRGTEQTKLSIDHPKFANSSIIKRKNVQFLRTKLSNDEKSYKTWKELLQNTKIDHQFLLIPRAEKFQASGICANTGSLQIDFNNHPYLLTQEIYNRKGKKSYFHETQMWYLLYAFIAAKKYLTDINGDSVGLLGDIRPSNVFINQHGQVRFSNLYSWPNQKINYQKTFQGIKTYLSPEDMDQLHLGSMDNKKNVYSQLFSIGLSLISVGILKDCSDIYDIENFKFNFFQATKRINAFKCSSVYSQLLRAIVGNLVSYQPQKRLLLEQIWNWITKYQRRIMTKQPFMIDEVPSQINSQINTLRSQLVNLKQQDSGASELNKNIKLKKSQLLNFKSNEKQRVSFNSPKQFNSSNQSGGMDLAVRFLRSPQAKQIFNFQRRVLIKSPQGFYQPKNVQKNGNKFKVFFQYKSPSKQFSEVHKAQTIYEKRQGSLIKKQQERPSSRQNRFVEQSKRQIENNKTSPIQKVYTEQVVTQAIQQIVIEQKKETKIQTKSQKEIFTLPINQTKTQSLKQPVKKIVQASIQTVISQNVIKQEHQQVVPHIQERSVINEVDKQNNFQISFESPPIAPQQLMLHGGKNEDKIEYFEHVKSVQPIQVIVKEHNQNISQDQEERVRMQIQKKILQNLQKQNKKEDKSQVKKNNEILILDESQHPTQQISVEKQDKIQNLKYQPKQIIEDITIQKPVFQTQSNQFREQNIKQPQNQKKLQENKYLQKEQSFKQDNTINSIYQKTAQFQHFQRPLIPLGPQKHEENSKQILEQKNIQSIQPIIYSNQTQTLENKQLKSNQQEEHLQLKEQTQQAINKIELVQQVNQPFTHSESPQNHIISLNSQNNLNQKKNNQVLLDLKVDKNLQTLLIPQEREKTAQDRQQSNQKITQQTQNFIVDKFERPLIPLGPEKNLDQIEVVNQIQEKLVDFVEVLSHSKEQEVNKQVISSKESQLKQVQEKCERQPREESINISTYEKSPVQNTVRPFVPLGPEESYQKLKNKTQSVNQVQKENFSVQNKSIQTSEGGLAGIMQHIKENLNQKIEKLKFSEKREQLKQQNKEDGAVQHSHQQTPIANIQAEVNEKQINIQGKENKVNVILVDSFESGFQKNNEADISKQIPFEGEKYHQSLIQQKHEGNKNSLSQHIQQIIDGFIETEKNLQNNQNKNEPFVFQNNHINVRSNQQVKNQFYSTKSNQIQNANEFIENLQSANHNYIKIVNAHNQQHEQNKTVQTPSQKQQHIAVTINQKQLIQESHKDQFLQNVKKMNEQINSERQQNLQTSRESSNNEIKQSQIQFQVMKEIVGVSKQIKIQQSQNLQSKSDTVPQLNNQAQLQRQIKEKGIMNRSSIPLDSQFGNISQIMDIKQFGDTINAKSELNFLATIRRNQEQNQMIEQLTGKRANLNNQNQNKIQISQQDKTKLLQVVNKLTANQGQSNVIVGQGKTFLEHQAQVYEKQNHNIGGLMTTTPVYEQSNIDIIVSERKTQNKTENNEKNRNQEHKTDIIEEVKQINKILQQNNFQQNVEQPKIIKASSMNQYNSGQVVQTTKKIDKYHSLQINEQLQENATNLMYSNRAQFSVSQRPEDLTQLQNNYKFEQKQVKSQEQIQNQFDLYLKNGKQDQKRQSSLNNDNQNKFLNQENFALKESLKAQHVVDIIDQVINLNEELNKSLKQQNQFREQITPVKQSSKKQVSLNDSNDLNKSSNSGNLKLSESLRKQHVPDIIDEVMRLNDQLNKSLSKQEKE